MVVVGLAVVVLVSEGVTVFGLPSPVMGVQAYVYGLIVGDVMIAVNVVMPPLQIATFPDTEIAGGVHAILF